MTTPTSTTQGEATGPERGISTTTKSDLGVFTSIEGIRLPTPAHSLNVGGHTVTSDLTTIQKQQAFNRSKIVERMVHPCGAGAFGYFEVTSDVASRHTKARFLDSVGKRTPIFVRFSTVTYGREFPDSARNPRGFAVKFYTEDGNYDIVGLNFPVFFNRDPAQGPDVVLSQRRNPKNFLVDFNAMFDFMSLVPESLHAGTMLFSDHGTPYGFRFMHGYGVHTFKWVNDAGEAVYVKYHFVCPRERRNFTWKQAREMCGLDPDFAKRDLYDTLERGEEIEWRVSVQIMPLADAAGYRWDPFDSTKIWHHADYPLIEIGRLVLDRNPSNYHRDVEQAAFSPGSFVPGVEPSPDQLLQFRAFFYRDAQYYRLGVNLHQVPVNCPYRADTVMHPIARDGLLRVDDNGDDDPMYYPNSVNGAPAPDPKSDRQPFRINDVLTRKASSRHAASENGLEEDLTPTRELYLRVMKDVDRDHLHYNMADALKWAKPDVQQRMLELLRGVHPDYADGVAKYLSAAMEQAKQG